MVTGEGLAHPLVYQHPVREEGSQKPAFFVETVSSNRRDGVVQGDIQFSIKTTFASAVAICNGSLHFFASFCDPMGSASCNEFIGPMFEMSFALRLVLPPSLEPWTHCKRFDGLQIVAPSGRVQSGMARGLGSPEIAGKPDCKDCEPSVWEYLKSKSPEFPHSSSPRGID